MATALTLPASDAIHQLPASKDERISIKESFASDGASFYNPEDSPSQGKYCIPSSPQLEVILKTETPTIVTPANAHPLRKANIPVQADPLAFIDTFLNAPPVWSPQSELEKEILKHQQMKTEQIEFKRQRDTEVAGALAVRIKEREGKLGALQAEMKRKVKHIESKKDALEQFRTDFAEAVKQQMPSSSTIQKSSLTRMREEQEKKKLLADWKNNNSEDQLQDIRRTILISQDEVNELNMRIVNLKKELFLLHQMAAKEVSSTFIMKERDDKRKEMTPQEIAELSAPRARPPPPAPILRSHQNRMAEAKEIKERARAARLASASVPSTPSNFASSSSSKAKQNP